MEQTTQEGKELVQRPRADVPIIEGKGLVPTSFEGLWRIAAVMAQSGFVPKDMANSPEKVFVACQMGLEVGLSLMASVQNIAVINGRPSMWGDSVLALVRASGKAQSFKERFEGTFPQDDFRAICETRRVGESELVIREFSVADAKAADLWVYPNKGVTPWHKYPKRMLQMRARSWALRDTYGDVLKGLRTAEEAMDFDMELAPDQSGTYSAPEVKGPSFDELLSTKAPYDAELVRQYVDLAAKTYKVTVDAAKAEIAKDFEPFWTAFTAWAEKQKKQEPKTEAKTESEKQAEAGPDSSVSEKWDPYTSEVQQRYPADKAAILKAEAQSRGIVVTGLLPKDVHVKLLASVAPAVPPQKPTLSDEQMQKLEFINELRQQNHKAAIFAGEKVGCGGGFTPLPDQYDAWIEAYDQWKPDKDAIDVE